jgi:hypothetical protein
MQLPCLKLGEARKRERSDGDDVEESIVAGKDGSIYERFFTKR